MVKKALVVGSGSLRGAYSAGVSETLGKELGSDYFDGVYSCSVGVYMATFFVADQPSVIEDTWRNRVSGRQLVNFLNPLKGRHVLDLEYLEEIFGNGRSCLDLSRLFRNETKLLICLTNSETGEPEYLDPRGGNTLRLMSASCAYPLLHPPVRLNGTSYFDGGLSDPLPVRKALDDGYDEVVAVLNKPKSTATRLGRCARLFRRFAMPFARFPNKIRGLIEEYEERRERLEEDLRDSRVKIIRPSKKLPLKNLVDTDSQRINETIDIGVMDARRFLEDYVQ